MMNDHKYLFVALLFLVSSIACAGSLTPSVVPTLTFNYVDNSINFLPSAVDINYANDLSALFQVPCKLNVGQPFAFEVPQYPQLLGPIVGSTNFTGVLRGMLNDPSPPNTNYIYPSCKFNVTWKAMPSKCFFNETFDKSCEPTTGKSSDLTTKLIRQMCANSDGTDPTAPVTKQITFSLIGGPSIVSPLMNGTSYTPTFTTVDKAQENFKITTQITCNPLPAVTGICVYESGSPQKVAASTLNGIARACMQKRGLPIDYRAECLIPLAIQNKSIQPWPLQNVPLGGAWPSSAQAAQMDSTYGQYCQSQHGQLRYEGDCRSVNVANVAGIMGWSPLSKTASKCQSGGD